MNLYLYIAVRNTDGIIKVGFSANPEKRIRQFGHGTPEGPYLMTLVTKKEIPDPNYRNETSEHEYYSEMNARILENDFKKKFSEYIIRGEWYRKECLADMLVFLKNHPMETFVVKYLAKSNGGKLCQYSHHQLRKAS